jgi:geranylgeranyl reductase family protein
MNTTVDVVVVGAGSAGCAAARRCAELGLKTLMIDRKPRGFIGQKVCGDEVSRSHFDATGIDYPQDAEILNTIDGADIYPPGIVNEMKVRGWKEFDGWILHRLNFGQRLLNEAIQAGVTFVPESHVTGPIVKDERVVGVEYKSGETGETEAAQAKLVVDASGLAGVVRAKLDHPLVEKRIAKSDIALCHREILRLGKPLPEANVARVFLGRRIAPSGYAWLFPRGPQEANVGVGVTGGEGKASPKSYLSSFKERYEVFHGSDIVESAGGAVPVRRPLMSLVADGVAFVGDSALQVNPIHGGGIGAGMRAGVILGEIAKQAVAREDTTARGLWQYNTTYLSDFGRRLASLEIFRRFLQDVSDEDIDFGFEKRVLEPGDLMRANRGDGLSIGLVDKLRRVGRSVGRPGLLLKLQRAASIMKRVSKAYAEYPSRPELFDKWCREVAAILDEAHFS